MAAQRNPAAPLLNEEGEFELILYELPLPPSVNAMFAHRGVKGAFSEARKAGRIGQPRPRGRYKTSGYREWSRQAGLHLLVQGPLQRISGPVVIRATITDRAIGDLDNRYKGISDFLVQHKIIEDDKKDIVKEIRLRWGRVEGARVEIWQADDQDAWAESPWLPRKVQNRSAA